MSRFPTAAVLTALLALAPPGFADEPGKQWAGKDLAKRDLRTENLERADLEDAKLFLANLKDGRLKGANLKGADLTSASLDGADLSGANLTDATLARASLQEANLSGANLSGQDLSETSLQRASLRGANLQKLRGLKDVTRADFRGADLRGANLLGAVDYAGATAKFQGAKYDRDTRWPKGFDVEGSGAVLAAEEKPAVPPGEAPAAVKPPVPEPSADPKPTAGDRPKDAPPDKDVKAQLEKTMWGPPMQGGTKHTYTYKTLKYGQPRKGEYRTDGVPANSDTTVYPVKVEVEILKTYTDGTTKTESKNQTYVFFKDEFGDWTFRFKGNN